MKIEDIVVSDNLVPDLDQGVIDDIRMAIMQQYKDDKEGMSDYLSRYESALELARMDSSKVETRIKDGAKVMMPYVMESAIDFNSRIVMEVLARDEIVFADITGPESDEKYERAHRVTQYANYCIDRAKWRRITDKEMMALPIVGTTYKKQWYDPISGSNKTGLIMADQVVFSQEVECFDDAPQVAHELSYPKSYMVSMKRAGLWEYDDSKLIENKKEYEFLEIQFCWDIDEDDYDEPYIAMVCKDTNEVVRIVPNFEPEDIRFGGANGDEVIHIDRQKYITQKQLLPDPEGRPMGLGFGILLHDIFSTINTNIRQLVDAGTFANLAGTSGLVAHGVQPRMNQSNRFQAGEVKMEMGRFNQIQVPGGMTLREAIVQPPFSGPNPVLFQLLGFLEESCRRMTVAGMQVEANANEAASLYLARLQQALKSPNAMIWRVCEGFREEFQCMFKLIARYGSDADYEAVTDTPGSLSQDFSDKDCDIVPTLNPAQGSDVERMARAEAQLSTAGQAPQMHNMREAYVRYYEAMGVEDIDVLLPEPDPNAVDPLQQLQMQYQAMEAEFRDREMSVKEQRLAIDQMKAVHEMRMQVEKMRSDLEGAEASKVETLTKAMKNLAEIADAEEIKALRRIEQMAASQQPQIAEGSPIAGE